MPLGHRWLFPTLVVSLLFGCAAPQTPVPTRLELNPSGALLTPGNPTRQLTATVYDQFDQPMQSQVNWTSSAPAAISVSASGLVEALDPTASALITATASGADASVLVVAALPVEGAVVISDENIVGDMTPVEPSAEVDVGYQYQITLAGVAAPALGDILLTDGVKAVAGKVVAVDAQLITLELVPIDEVFGELDINASIDLADAPFTTPESLQVAYESERLADGSVRLRQRPGAALTSADALAPQAAFNAGPFRCETQLGGVTISLAQSTLTFHPDLHFDIVWNNAQRKVVVRGSPKVSLDVIPVVSAAIEGKIGCKLTFREIQIPMPGPLGLFIAAVVPIGAGFDIGGKLPLGQVGAEFKSTVGANLQLGFDCNPDCVPIESMTRILEGNAKPRLPTALSGLKVEASAFAFLFARLEGGARFSSTLRVEAIDATAGLKLDAKLASEETQAFDESYASQYEALFEGSIGAGTGFQSFLNLVKVTVAKFQLKLVESIAKSPHGTVAANRAEFSVGDTVDFEVTLDPATISFPVVGHNVSRVRVYRKSADSLILANEAFAVPGQNEFEIPWVATADGTVEGNFVAFVETILLPSPRLELGAVTVPGTTASMVYTSDEEYLEEQAAQDFTRRLERRVIYTASFQLRLLSETPEEMQFEIVSGSAGEDRTDDLEESTFNNDGGGDCFYDEFVEDHSTTQGGGPASGLVFLSRNGGNHAIGASSQEFPVTTNGVWSVKYVFRGSGAPCKDEITEPYQDQDEGEMFISVEGTNDPGTPHTYSGSDLLQDVGYKRTRTWTLTIQ